MGHVAGRRNSRDHVYVEWTEKEGQAKRAAADLRVRTRTFVRSTWTDWRRPGRAGRLKNPARIVRSRRDRSRPLLSQRRQSTAISSAPQISCMRASASRPSRVTSRETETLSTESKLTAERRGTGSSPGSRTTSLGSPLIVVVQGATIARPSRGIAASRDKTTTGRRPISAGSHHQSSPRAGSALTRTRRPAGTTPGRPTRPLRRAGGRHRRHSLRPLLRHGGERAVLRGPCR